jgi:S1-C subfamily serine protease
MACRFNHGSGHIPRHSQQKTIVTPAQAGVLDKIPVFAGMTCNPTSLGVGLFNKIILWACLFLLLALPVCAQAQQRVMRMEYFKVQSGTGFYVNDEYIVTNQHVVNGCDHVSVKGAVPEHTALVKVADETRDLALIQTDRAPEEIAPLRYNIEGLKAGDKVYVIGYPGEEGTKGQYRVATGQVQDVKPEMGGKPGWFYISDIVEHGNSGGPVFDTSGNVVGVVVAKTVLETVNARTRAEISEQNMGVAITLDTLKQFLLDNGVYTQWGGSGLLYADSYIEDHAKNYIVNVQCRIPTDAQGNVLDNGGR